MDRGETIPPVVESVDVDCVRVTDITWELRRQERAGVTKDGPTSGDTVDFLSGYLPTLMPSLCRPIHYTSTLTNHARRQQTQSHSTKTLTTQRHNTDRGVYQPHNATTLSRESAASDDVTPPTAAQCTLLHFQPVQLQLQVRWP
ncbi:hypothetical protein J6590_033786 [Homalodisca vitripennis]|nr:hypothetical protein J6590_033786 [Homalodisca vitripennis]